MTETTVHLPYDSRSTVAGLHSEALERRAEGQSDDPSAQSIPYIRMRHRFDVVLDTLGGTEHMRALGTKYVPAEEGEQDQSGPDGRTPYQRRLLRAELIEATDAAIGRVCDRMFAVPVRFGDESGESKDPTAGLPEEVAPIVKDADRQGTSLSDFTKALVRDAATFGRSFVMVDMPRQRPASLAQQRALDLRPYLSIVSGYDLFAWKWRRIGGDRRALAQIRYRQDRQEVPAGSSFGETNVQRIVVWNFRYTAAQERDAEQPTGKWDRPGTYSVWVRDDVGGEWKPETAEPLEHGIVGLNLVPLYFRKEAEMEARPPFEDLARTLVRWWNSEVEQTNNLHFARYELRGLHGGTGEEFTEFCNVGNVAYHVGSPESRPYRLGAPVEGIEAGWRDLERLEERMVSQGLAPFVRHASAKATDSILSESKSLSEAQSWAHDTAEAVVKAVRIAGEIVNRPVPESWTVTIHDEFLAMLGSTEDARLILEAARIGLIDKRGFYGEWMRMGKLGRRFDVARAIREAEPLGGMGETQNVPRAGGETAIEAAEGGPAAGRTVASPN